MTPKIIELKQAPVALVELPVGWENTKNIDGRDWIGYLLHKHYGVPLQYRTLGRLLELTEDQFAECVEINKQGLFKRYTSKYNVSGQEFKELDPKESFNTLLESENVYTENPYKHPNDIYTNRDDSNIFQKLSMRKWQEAQSRTIDPKRTVVLLRKESE